LNLWDGNRDVDERIEGGVDEFGIEIIIG